MSEYVRKINKEKISITAERWSDLKQYYMSMYHFYMLVLYDEGYIKDPTVYNEKEIRANFVDLGITDFVDWCGRVIITSEYTKLAMCRQRDDEDINHYLQILYSVLKYREYCIELDKQYEINNSVVKLNLGIRDVSKLTTLSNIKYNKGVFTTLIKDGYELEEVSFRGEIWDLAMEELGIAKSDYCDGMFVCGLTLEEEIEFSKIILNGEVIINGKYADKLIKWLEKNKWEGQSSGLYSHVFRVRDKEVLDLFDRVTEEYADRLVLFYEDTVYLKKEIEYYNIPIGFFCVVSTEDESDIVITETNALYGYTGEAYTVDYLLEEGIECIGVPIIINFEGNEFSVYDESQLAVDIHQNSWFSTDGASFTFEEDYDLDNPFEEGTIEHELINAYIMGMRGWVYRIKKPEGGFKAIKQARKKISGKMPKYIE